MNKCHPSNSMAQWIALLDHSSSASTDPDHDLCPKNPFYVC